MATRACGALPPPGGFDVTPSPQPLHAASCPNPSHSRTPPALQPITGGELGAIAGPATMHAIGHVAANLSFAAVAISLTHTVKTLEPAFNVALSKIVLGVPTPFPVVLSLVPIMVGVALASAADLSFNWTGFISAMISNLTFGFRAVWSKRCVCVDGGGRGRGGPRAGRGPPDAQKRGEEVFATPKRGLRGFRGRQGRNQPAVLEDSKNLPSIHPCIHTYMLCAGP